MKKGSITYALVRALFFIGSLVYLAIFAYQSFDFNELRNWLSIETSAHIILASVIFAATTFFSVLGWRAILVQLGQPKSIIMVAHAFCLTQIAKYVPGNVAHHAGRVAMGKSSLGIPAGLTIVSILQESALACLAALLVGTFFMWTAATLGYGSVHLITLGEFRIEFTAVLALVITAGLAALVVVNLWRKHSAAPYARIAGWLFRITPSWPAVGSALPSYAAIYVINGIALWVVAVSVLRVEYSDFLLLTSAYSLSWMIGFLLPGAPGGLGVREAALAILLNGLYPDDAVFSILVLSRVSSIFADLLILFYGLYLSRKMDRGREPAQ